MLGDVELAVYQLAVRRKGASVDEIAFALGLTLQELQAARTALVQSELIEPGDGDQPLVARPPEVALARRIYDDEMAVRALEHRIVTARSEYLALVPHFIDARRGAGAPDDTEVMTDPETIRTYVADLCRDTREELLIAHTSAHLSVSSLREGLPQDIELLARGVTRRNLYPTSNRDSTAVRRAVSEMVSAGGEVRVLDSIPVRVMCFDGQVALVSRDAEPGDSAAIVVRSPLLVKVIRRCYMAVWESADPFLGDTQTKPDTLTAKDRAVLDGLARGLSDEQIARRLNLSVRTARRRVHELMATLGAESRFQAGVLAERRKLL